MRTFFAVIILIVFGQIFFWGGVSDSFKAVRAKSWPTVEGEIRVAKMMVMKSRRGGTSYKPALRYVYEVEGRRHNGELLNFGDGGAGSMDEAGQILMRYPPETKVTVHYHPKEHELAVLETGIADGNLFKVILGAVMTVIGGWIGFRSYRRITAEPVAPSTGF